MTDITRRKFLSLAPASVVAVALGGMALGAGAAQEPLLPPRLITPEQIRGTILDTRVFGDGSKWREFVFSTTESMTIEFTEPVSRVYVGVPYTAVGSWSKDFQE